MIPGTCERVHAELLEDGYALTTANDLGLPLGKSVVAALGSALTADPRGPGKLHARDVLSYVRSDLGTTVSEHGSTAHGGVDDFSRFWALHDLPRGGPAITRLLDLVPPSLRRPAGRMSADYFRYSPGAGAGPHQDKFGDLVIIWSLDRDGGGAESFLTTLDGQDVMRGPLAPGTILIFRDDLFLHGVTPLADGHRDVLIFITLRDSQ